uniref:Oligopeptide transporter 4 n=1 Tax=Aegilops tauschii TaxID=37682 RepID=M8BF77_AEGTA
MPAIPDQQKLQYPTIAGPTGEFHRTPMPSNFRVPSNTFKKDCDDDDAAARTSLRISPGTRKGMGERALHEKEEFAKGSRQISRFKFFLVVLICSFSYYALPGFIFQSLTSIAWVCWAFPKSVTAQQLGSGLKGLGLGAFTLDWETVASYLGSPLITPFFAIANIFVGYVFFVWVLVPTAYWGTNLYHAKTFPLFSTQLFMSNGTDYDIDAIVNKQFELDYDAYNELGRVNISTFFALAYGLSFATIAATISHVGLFYGKEISQRFRVSRREDPDIHTKLMRTYEDIPAWWFYSLTVLSMTVALILCTVLIDQVQLPWWGLVFACGMSFVFTLPISIITATTNQANFKLGHYMKIPPRSMFVVQFVGTIVAGTINLSVAWWLLGSVENICHIEKLSANSPWTCPNDRVFFDASVIWGLVGPRRIFGPLGNYAAINYFFLIGAASPFVVYIFHRIFPDKKWILLINLPVLINATASMPPATAVNYNSWLLVGTIFNFFVFRYRKRWWQRYNYIFSAAMDAGVAFMAVLLYFALTMQNRSIVWWGTAGEHCPLAICPTSKGVDLGPESVCPVF